MRVRRSRRSISIQTSVAARRTHRRLPLLALLAVALPSLAHSAEPIVTEYFDYDAFLSAAGVVQIADFDDLTHGNDQTTAETFLSQGFTATERNGNAINVLREEDNVYLCPDNFASFPQLISSDFFLGQPYFDEAITSNIDFVFTNTTYAVGLWIGSIAPSPGYTEAAMLAADGTVLASEQFDSSHAGIIGGYSHDNRVFYGVVSSKPIDRISTTEEPWDQDSVTYDDVQYAPAHFRMISTNDAVEAAPLAGEPLALLTVLNAGPAAHTFWRPVIFRERDNMGEATSLCHALAIAWMSGAEVANPPASLAAGASESALPQVIPERFAEMLATDVTVNITAPGSYPQTPTTPAVIPNGSRVNSYLLHFDPPGITTATTQCSVTFASDVLGIVVGGAALDASDFVLGLTSATAAGTTYPSDDDARGPELTAGLELVELDADGRTVTVLLRDGAGIDEIRVITVGPDTIEGPYVDASLPIAGVDEVTYDNCASAFYRFTFDMPYVTRGVRLHGALNGNDLTTVFLNGVRLTPEVTEEDLANVIDRLAEASASAPYGVSTSRRPFSTLDPELFAAGENELTVGVLNADGEPPCGLELRAFVVFDHAIGDVNCDGRVNAFDIDPFVEALLDQDAYEALYPNCEHANADIDQDGAVSAFDIDAFVTLLVGG